MSVSLSYRIDWQGRLHPHHVRLVWTNEPRPTTPAIEERIAATWLEELELARRHGRLLYDGRLARLVRVNFADDAAEWVLGPTTYRDFLGTNLRHAEDAMRAGGPECLSNALGVSILPVTSDGYVALGLRSERVAQHGGMVHPFGGMVEPDDGTPPNGGQGHPCPDIFAAAGRELMEETGLRDGEFSSPVLIGLARDLSIHQPEAVFETRTTLTREQLESRFAARGNEEHAAVLFSKVHDGKARSDLQQPGSRMLGKTCELHLTPISRATLRLIGV